MKINYNRYKKAVLTIWIIVLISSLVFYLFNPEKFTSEKIADYISSFEGSLWVVFILLSLVRGVTFIPPTILVIAGTLIFKENLLMVLIVSSICSVITAMMIYYLSSYLNIENYLIKKNSKRYEHIKKRVNSKYAWWFIIAWALIPIFPSDLIFYICGIVKIDKNRFASAVFVGHSIYYAVLIFTGSYIL